VLVSKAFSKNLYSFSKTCTNQENSLAD